VVMWRKSTKSKIDPNRVGLFKISIAARVGLMKLASGLTSEI